MTRIKNIKTATDIGFRVHTANLLQDIIPNQFGHNAGVLKAPLNIFQRLLALVGERAAEINDPELNILMLSLGIYEVNPNEIPDAIENQIIEMNKIKK